MATLYQQLQARVTAQREVHFNPRQFLQEHVLRTWWLATWLLILTYITVSYTLGQLQENPVSTVVVLLLWAGTVGWTAFNAVTRQHTPTTRWLSNNLYSSITNAQISLLLTLLIIALARGFVEWAFINASFSTDPETAAATLDQLGQAGATWGAVIDNFRNLMVFRFPREETWRIYAILVLLAALGGASSVVYTREQFRRSAVRSALTGLWLLLPIITFVLLRGIEGFAPLEYLNPNRAWGGLLLTLIIAVFGIVASFPLGVLLALGRRSTIRGIPGWFTWLVAIAITVWGLWTSTPENLAVARTTTERLLSYWPLAIPVIAFLFQRYFDGNVVALSSTLYIEMWRGIPFITVLFMSSILFPIFLPPDLEILGVWRVLAAAALFAAAYLAENVRGGLQSIPKGQYEAADAVGLNTYKKYRLIILPQALRAVIPAIVGQFIGLFKDTTLVAIVGLTELLGVASLISSQPDWLGVRRAPYVFVAVIYFIGSAIMAWYSRRLERQLGVGQR